MGARHPKASILQPASHLASESDLPPIPAATRLLRVRRPGARGGVLQAALRVVHSDFVQPGGLTHEGQRGLLAIFGK